MGQLCNLSSCTWTYNKMGLWANCLPLWASVSSSSKGYEHTYGHRTSPHRLSKGPVIQSEERRARKTWAQSPQLWVSVQDTQLLWAVLPLLTARRGINLVTGLKNTHIPFSQESHILFFLSYWKSFHRDILGCLSVLFIIVKRKLSKFAVKDHLSKLGTSIWQSIL